MAQPIRMEAKPASREIAALATEVCGGPVSIEKGRESGIPTPANEGIIAAVRKVERGEAAQSPRNIAAI